MNLNIIILVLLLAACSPLDVVKSAFTSGNGPSLEVDTTVGDKEEAVVGQVGSSTEIQAESLSGGINTTHIQDIPPWVVLILVLGWMLPSPSEMYREIKSWRKK